MQITLYQRTYPVKDAPVALSLVPFAGHQRHTFPVGDKVYEAECRELQVIIPDDAKIDPQSAVLIDRAFVRDPSSGITFKCARHKLWRRYTFVRRLYLKALRPGAR